MKRLSILSFLFLSAAFFLFSCQKELSQESNSNTATFSLVNDSTKQCLSIPTVHGTYYEGVSAKRDTNYVTLVVNVKTTGTYTISSNTQNGFSFSDSGFFSKTGYDTITLKALGTPILIQTSSFSISDSTCGYTVNVLDSTGTGLGSDTSGSGTSTHSTDSSYTDPSPAAQNTWHFTDTATKVTYSGKFISPGGGFFRNDTLIVVGNANTSTDSVFGTTLIIPSGTLATGIFPITENNNIVFTTTLGNTDIYSADDNSAEEGKGNSYITITSYNSTTHELAASFHTYAETANGTVTLLEGSFDCIVQ